MALSRALFNEFRPLFRVLEDPFTVGSPLASQRGGFDPFQVQAATPALNLSEENDKYIVEAEIPGVTKENLDLRIGDGGRSLTIEGKVIRGRRHAEALAGQQASSQQAEPSPSSKDTTTMTKTQDDNKQLSHYGGGYSDIRTFTRTVWLPQRIDSNSVKAKLDHGVLTVEAAKAKDESIRVPVE